MGPCNQVGADSDASDWKNMPVDRLARFIEESVDRGTRWAALEPNGEPLWAKIRQSVGSFLEDLFRKGAFAGQAPDQAYFVRCDSTTMTQQDIDQGIVNIVVGFAPVQPAEFVIITIQQMAGQSRS